MKTAIITNWTALFLVGVNFMCSQTLVDRAHFKVQPWYPTLMQLLSKENKIDSSDARYLKMISSNSPIAFEESVSALIKRYGTISEPEILSMLSLKEGKDSVIYVFTQSGQLTHLFSFKPGNGEFSRIRNSGVIVLFEGEEMRVKEKNKNSLLFYSCIKSGENPGGSWYKYFNFNILHNNLAHVKNCRLNKNKEECVNVSH